MPKRNLTEQIRSTKYREPDAAGDLCEYFNFNSERLSERLRVVMLPLARLVEYKDDSFERITGRPQPFRAYTQEDLESLARSIAEHGVIDPITVRPIDHGKYQIIAGRNRVRACAVCGLSEIPGMIREGIDDIKAAMLMLDTNLEQRHNLSYSEKAYAYKMRLDLQKQQGRRTDLEGSSEKLDTLATVGKKHNDSRRTVAYLIRLTYLLPELLSLVDTEKIGFMTGVEISYLSKETQTLLLQQIQSYDGKVKKGQAADLRKLESLGLLDAEAAQRVLRGPATPFPTSITISSKKLAKYADLLNNPKELERLFLEFLEHYAPSKSA